MARIARSTVMLVLALVALPLPLDAASAQTGLTFEAKRAELAADPTVVVLRGTYSCGPFPGGVPERGVIDLTVRQARPDEQVTGFGFFEPSVCDGTLQRFAASVAAVSGSFRRGPRPGARPASSRPPRALRTCSCRTPRSASGADGRLRSSAA